MSETPLLALHQTAGARFCEEAGVPLDFGDAAWEHRACREAAVAIDLSHRGRLRFTGPDAEEFLHRILSNRVQELKPGEGVYNTFLTRQGKLISDLYLYKQQNSFTALLAPGMASVFAEEIDKFIIMDQVEVSDETDASFCIALFGPHAREVLKGAGFGEVELPEHGHLAHGSLTIARELWTGEDGYLLTGHRQEAETLWRVLVEAGAAQAGLAAFGSLTLEAGLPLFGTDMTEAINPMQAGLAAKAIDFEKGCYIGQEVIAKIKYLGRVNRGLVRLRLEGDTLPAAGAAVHAGEKSAGAITRAAYCPTEEAVLAFSYLPRAHMAPGTRVRVDCGETDTGAVVDLSPCHAQENAANA